MVDGLLTIPVLVEAARSMDMMAIALTDHCALFGLIKFYEAALKAGVKPIVGADLLLVDEAGSPSTSVIRLFCQNATGYHHLTQLISRAYTEGQRQGQPTIEWAWLKERTEGLIVLSGAAAGDVGQALLCGDHSLAAKRLMRWQDCFQDRYYLELQRLGNPGDEQQVMETVHLAEKHQVPVVATQAVRFLLKADFEAHEARVCIREGSTLADPKRPHRYTREQYLKSPQEMSELFADLPEALLNTVEIAKRCTVELTLGQVHLPQFPVPEDISLESHFRQEAQKGLQQRLQGPVGEAYQQRLDTELDVIIKMGFPGYFLIVADFIQWAKRQDIPVGPGRGSGAGSLVAYALGITELDPLAHDLLFERFLNPERISLPDFDIDFCMEGRDRVIDYVAKRYGRECVAQIITFGTMAAKAVVRDVGRVLGMPYGFVDQLAKLIPFELGMTLDKALRQEEELMKRYQQEEEVRGLIDLALKLEGIARNAGKHAGGVVIAPTRLTDFTALYCEPEGEYLITQFDKNDVESVGLVKFDFLGLRTLTIIHWAVRQIQARHQEDFPAGLDISRIPLDDLPTFELLKRCETSAVFQLESRGMKDLIRRLQPDCFDDITALVALFRPGPLQSGMVDDFIDRKHGLAKVEYLHPELESILKPTYGVILYQEQVMQIAQVLAGYSLGGADLLRRAMGKKKPEEMAQQRSIFVEGAAARGVEEAVAASIFDLMEKFAGYGFNKSHSAAYALIAYQTAWLKAHYPAEFMAAVLSSDMDNTDKVVSFYQECQRMGIVVKRPAINNSAYAFTVDTSGEIAYGLGAIKGLGQSVIDLLVEERERRGPYRDLWDLCVRADLRKLNRRALEALIASGALDAFGWDRGMLIASIDSAVKAADQQHHNQLMGQSDLFSESPTTSPVTISHSMAASETARWSLKKRLETEYEVLGQYLSGHPLQIVAHEIGALVSAPIGKLQAEEGVKRVLAGMIISARVIHTKLGRRMGILTVEDETGRIDVTVFSKLYDVVREYLVKGNVIVVKGEIAHDDFTGGLKCTADELTALEKARERMAKRVRLTLSHQMEMSSCLPRLSELIKPYMGGTCSLVIHYQTEQVEGALELGASWRIRPTDQLLELLSDLLSVPVQVEYA